MTSRPTPDADNNSRRIIPGSDRERRVLIGAVVLFFLVLALDQATKIWVDHSFELYESIPVIPGCFSLTYVTNPGAAWGILAGKGWFLLSVAVVVSLGALLFLRRLTEGWSERYFALLLILSGVFGNSIDRIWRGEVVDFLDCYYGSWHWPTFNVADIAICVGVGIFILSSIVRPTPNHGSKDNIASEDQGAA